MHHLIKTIAGAAMLAIFTLPSQAGDAEKGAKVYRKCVSCHMIGDGAKNRVGPQLNGIIGREIGAIADYKYSKAMVQYAATAKIWSEENLAAYLENPRKLVKGWTHGICRSQKRKRPRRCHCLSERKRPIGLFDTFQNRQIIGHGRAAHIEHTGQLGVFDLHVAGLIHKLARRHDMHGHTGRPDRMPFGFQPA